ncbi:MAG: hypothetical protein K0S70_1040 [Microbacterium sp.]|nr:hypothetical protein [Microbacterium sp.]
MPENDLEDVAVVVVHHKRHDEIADVVRGILAQGISPVNVLLVDNSEVLHREDELRAAVSPVRVLFTKNQGYGAAANAGRSYLRENDVPFDKLVVATHEVVLSPNALRALSRALDGNPAAGAAGPTLSTSAPDGRAVTWSTGGDLRRVARLPFHHVDSVEPGAVTRRTWLDGAMVMYRAAAIPPGMFDESFVMYMEELDLHLRMGQAGWILVHVADAKAWQSSDGVPPYYFARNLRLLAKKHFNGLTTVVTTAYGVARRAASTVKKRRARGLRELARGVTEKLPEWRATASVVNPLSAALSHYVSELGDIADLNGSRLRLFAFPEPSASGEGRVKWLLRYVVTLRRAMRVTRARNVIVTWPVIGYLDIVVAGLLGRGASIVFHDPTPLVRARGYSAMSRELASRFGGRVRLVTHGTSALAEVQAAVRAPAVLVPHPIRASRSISARSTPVRRPLRVSVLGQYKPDRDTDLLVWLAEQLGPGIELHIIGRGWPDINGWTVDSRFVSESEFEQAIRDATVILVPYRRFYQSGVAIRALENNVPVVGPQDSVLADMFGVDSPMLATGTRESWLEAITYAMQADAMQIDALRSTYTEKSRRGWEPLLAGSKGA